MIYRIVCLIGAMTMLFSSCQTPGTMVSADPARQQLTKPEIITESLFDANNSTISEADIQRLLNGRIVIPDSLRIAVYKYGGTSVNRYYSSYWTNEEYLKTQQSFLDSLVAQLKPCRKIEEVVLVPSLMTSGNPGITQLREAAVRLQADLLLVFSVNSDIYYKYKALQKNESKAFATCETILLDTRTGVIPHSSVVTKENLLVKEKEDWTNQELRKRAENGAIALTLMEAGQRVTAFLDR